MPQPDRSTNPLRASSSPARGRLCCPTISDQPHSPGCAYEPTPPRAAEVGMHQLPDGYWYGSIHLYHPGLVEPFTANGSSFHNAGEVLDWARQTIESVVSL